MSHSLFFFLSVLSALEATQVRQCYQSQHYLTTFSGSTSSVILSRLPIACWFCCPPCLLASAALTFSHKLSTHANTHPLILQTTHDYMLHPACLRGTLSPSLLAISFLPPFIYLTFSLISSLHLLSLDFFLPLPNCHFFLLTHSASHSLLHLVLFLCYGGDLIYNQNSAVLKLSGTQVGCNWSAQLLIDQSQRDR